MGDTRIGRQALSPMPELLSYWLPADDARTLLAYINDTIAAMVAQAPDRFVGLGGIPLQDMDMALMQLRQQHGESPSITALTGTYHNLLRMWATP